MQQPRVLLPLSLLSSCQVTQVRAATSDRIAKNGQQEFAADYTKPGHHARLSPLKQQKEEWGRQRDGGIMP